MREVALYFKLVLAGVLLWLDFRLFLFLAFLFLLKIEHRIDHLRAALQVHAALAETFRMAVLESLGISVSQRDAQMKRYREVIGPDGVKKLDADMELFSGGQHKRLI